MRKFGKLISIIKTLRGPQGCPWDRKQKPPNYKAFFLEEVYELFESIDKRSVRGIQEELGDLLLLIVALSAIFEEQKKFTIDSVVSSACEKLIARHPHVFSSRKVRNAEEVIRQWVERKRREKRRKTIYERIPKQAPALLKAHVFFKELKYVNQLDIRSILRKKKKVFFRKKNSQEIARELLALAYLAFCNRINSEEALRQEIFRLAKKYRYDSSAGKMSH